MDTTALGKMLFAAGILLAAAGLMLWFGGGFGFLGKLPGDISVKRENFEFHFPIVTSILVSVVLSLVLWLFRR